VRRQNAARNLNRRRRRQVILDDGKEYISLCHCHLLTRGFLWLVVLDVAGAHHSVIEGLLDGMFRSQGVKMEPYDGHLGRDIIEKELLGIIAKESAMVY
jgi:hypothetical protein